MEEKNKKVITRFAPSPTGLPHLGTAMYALLNYLYAHQNDGKVIMRSEDTDPVRSKLEYEKAIIDGLTWLGIKADDFYRQSDRTEIYKKYIAKMIADKTAYVASDTNEKGETRDVVRFKNPNKVITFHDSSRGDISVDTTDLGDFIIARDINSPLYHLTVVVDDYETGVTHIIRGEDGLANTPRQILIQEAIGAQRPIYAHYPFILLSNHTKMGKRNGAKSIQEYMALGYLPEAIVNFVILMAWHPKDDREIFTLSDLLKEFQLDRIGKSGAILDEKKLNWLNKEYIKLLSQEDRNQKIVARLKTLTIPDLSKLDNKNFADKLSTIIFEYINVWSDIDTMYTTGELTYFFEQPTYPAELLLWKKTPDVAVTKSRLEKIREIFSLADDKDFDTSESVKNLIWNFVESEGKSPSFSVDGKIDRGSVLWPLRTALSGMEKSPDPFTLASIFGKQETIARLDKAIQKL